MCDRYHNYLFMLFMAIFGECECSRWWLILFPELAVPLQLPITKLLLPMDLSVLLLLLLSLLLNDDIGISLPSVKCKKVKRKISFYDWIASKPKNKHFIVPRCWICEFERLWGDVVVLCFCTSPLGANWDNGDVDGIIWCWCCNTLLLPDTTVDTEDWLVDTSLYNVRLLHIEIVDERLIQTDFNI